MSLPELCFSVRCLSFNICRRKNCSVNNQQKPRIDMKDETASQNSQDKADELEERLIDFAVRIIKLSANLPKTPAGKHISGQILRSGTSPAPNYGEARGAESHADFVHKLGVVLKELNETCIWLRVIERGELVKPELLIDIIDENKQLCRIFIASLKTTRAGKK
ncbi:MAG: four helix bundle protein [Blastocatellia bacterium]